MASEGIIFRQHYAGSTVCGPSRAVLMTGQHLGHATVRGNPTWTLSGKPVDLKDEDITVAEELKRAGYATAVIEADMAIEAGEAIRHLVPERSVKGEYFVRH
jgi:arylsulfatase A-like enzyme